MMERKTYSIIVRFQRTVMEEAFVGVPLNAEVVDPTPDESGQRHVDGKKVMEVAVRMGADPNTRWAVEGEPTIEPHPIESPPPHTRN
jgi:hypothetical protein